MANIDECLANTNFPLPAIRQVNMAKHPTSISLGLGELKDFDVDEKILEAMRAALKNDGLNYSQNAGLPELREAIAQKQKKEDGFIYSLNNVVITIGVQNAMYATLKTLAKLGAKRVLIPEINFGIYKKIPPEFGLNVETYKLTSNFGIDTKNLEAQLQNDDIVILNSPSNPTGRVFTNNEQRALGQLFDTKLNDGYVISDEIYGKLVYDGEPYHSFSKYFSRTIVFDGISKSAAAAGLRVGWVITQNEKLAQAITSTNAVVLSCPPTANQYAALPVVNGETVNRIQQYNFILKRNRDVAVTALKKAKIPYILPRGSFYIFPKVDALISGSVKEFCVKTAQKENGVVVIPGEAFGTPNHVRISLASMEIEEGMKRFIDAVLKNQ
ncbi:MAG: pyridoxal phosphate-dependent aminotransferase [Salinivirgaceae bacterium]|jgi:aspartate aminotransferase|nr:pyridoxal phosphate-dependent aminotransferase [Salinivirgaceae bacterium]